MIDVQAVLKDIPHFDTFCSVEKLHKQVETLRAGSALIVLNSLVEARKESAAA